MAIPDRRRIKVGRRRLWNRNSARPAEHDESTVFERKWGRMGAEPIPLAEPQASTIRPYFIENLRLWIERKPSVMLRIRLCHFRSIPNEATPGDSIVAGEFVNPSPRAPRESGKDHANDWLWRGQKPGKSVLISPRVACGHRHHGLRSFSDLTIVRRRRMGLMLPFSE